MPNADTDGRALIKIVEKFTSNHSNAHAFISLGQLRYLSCISHVDGVVGNSSSGLLEVPSFRKGTINIGDRQRGRLQASSVINCEANQKSISSGIEMLYEPEFQLNLSQVRNPYGEEGASDKIVDILKTISIKNIVKKTFHDLTNLNIGHNK